MDPENLRNVATPLVASAALGVSLYNLARARRQDRRDLFLKLHVRLTEPELQAGRRLLHARIKSLEDAAHVAANDVQDYDRMNRALAGFDVLGLYVSEGFVDRDLVLREWADSLHRIGPAAEAFIGYRSNGQEWALWPHFQQLRRDAEVFLKKDGRL